MTTLFWISTAYSAIGIVHMAIVPVRRVYDHWEREMQATTSWTTYSTLYYVLMTLLWPMAYVRMAWRWIRRWISGG